MHFDVHAPWWSELAGSAELAVVVLQADGSIEYASPYLASLVGESADALTRRDFVKALIADAYKARASNYFLRDTSDGYGMVATIPIRSVRGAEVHVRWTRAKSMTGSSGVIHIASGVDVTPHVRQASEMSAERARQAQAERVARIGSWEVDHRAAASYWSHEVYRLLEVDPHTVAPSYKAFLSRVHEDDREALERTFRASLKSGKPFRIRHRIGLHGTRVRWVEVRGEIAFDAAGAPLVSKGTVQDVTFLIEAEEAIRRSEAAVSSFLQVSPEAVVVTDRTGEILTFSDGAELVFRCQRADLIGKPIEDLIPDRFRSNHRRLIEAFVTSDQPSLLMAERTEIRGKRLTGEEFAAEATVSRLPGRNGDQFAVILRDLSERKAYETALESAKIRAEAANEAKSAFLATMSHEIRTPMNAVLGMLSVLGMEQLSPAQHEMVEIAIDAGHSLMELLNDILDYSRIEAGQLRLEFTQSQIRSVLKKVQTLHAFKVHATGVALEIVIDPSVPEFLLIDPTRIQQILHNLVSNAVKFTQKGRIEVGASYVSGERDAHALVLTVADTGIGIGKDQVSIIFDRFTQADTSITRKFGGSGLGLSIVKGLVDAMGGRIDVSSELGKGARFTVRIPVHPMPGERQGAQSQRSAGVSMAHRPMRVLVAEDNVLNADTLRLLSDREAVSVSIARTGEDVLKLFEPGRYDLIFMDIQLPSLDGESVVKVVRKLEAATGRASAIVVACTAHLDEDRRARYRRLGFDHVLTKPVDPDEVKQLVQFAALRVAGRLP